VKIYFLGAAVAVLVGCPLAQQSPVPVEQEPHHHVVLTNESMLVTHVVIPAGETTLYHTHSYDRAAVHLTNSMVTFQLPGQTESEPAAAKIGEISASTRQGAPLTHRVRNTGPGAFEVIDVEFLKRPEQPSVTAAATVGAENPSARIYKWVLAPGASSAMHTHERPYLIIAATPMQLKVTGPEGKSSSHAVKAGDLHWIDSRVTHTLTNDGVAEGQMVEIELK
jgi:quercetin dioxygenase-like cupin family protein